MTDMTNEPHWDLIAGPWRIERNDKMQFRIVRGNAEIGVEALCSASGRPSSFKTWPGAQRALKALQRQGA